MTVSQKRLLVRVGVTSPAIKTPGINTFPIKYNGPSECVLSPNSKNPNEEQIIARAPIGNSILNIFINSFIAPAAGKITS